jgi:hypothetical protein
MIRTESFPGWESFGALVSHLKFVADHHRQIERIAAVTDSGFLKIVRSRGLNSADTTTHRCWMPFLLTCIIATAGPPMPQGLRPIPGLVLVS